VPDTEATESFSAFGHANVQATHRATLEFTKDKHLTREGNCIVATFSDKSVADLSSEFKKCLRKPNAKLTVLIEAGGIVEEIHAHGSPRLMLSHPTDIVVRKSDHICGRTLAVCADKAAVDLSRELVEKLKDPKQKAKITFKVRC